LPSFTFILYFYFNPNSFGTNGQLLCSSQGNKKQKKVRKSRRSSSVVFRGEVLLKGGVELIPPKNQVLSYENLKLPLFITYAERWGKRRKSSFHPQLFRLPGRSSCRRKFPLATVRKVHFECYRVCLRIDSISTHPLKQY